MFPRDVHHRFLWGHSREGAGVEAGRGVPPVCPRDTPAGGSRRKPGPHESCTWSPGLKGPHDLPLSLGQHEPDGRGCVGLASLGGIALRLRSCRQTGRNRESQPGPSTARLRLSHRIRGLEFCIRERTGILRQWADWGTTRASGQQREFRGQMAFGPLAQPIEITT